MARIPDIERRLQNWARWRLGGLRSVLGYASVDLSDPTAGCDAWDAQPVIPTLDCEASEMQSAVMALDSVLRATVEAVYLGPGGMRQKARRLCCSEATIHARIDRAHRVISAWMTDRAAQARVERERVEKLLSLKTRAGSFTD